MNRKLFTLVLALLFTFSLAACGGGAEEPVVEEPAAEEPAAEEPAAPAEAAKVVIFIGMGTGTDPDQIAAQEALQEEFNNTHDDIVVEFLIVPHEEAGERFLAMLSGGNAPQLVGPNGISTVAEFFDTWADVTPYIEADNLDQSDFYGPATELNSYPEKVVGLPLGLFPSFLYYNEDLFDAAGLDYPTHDYNDKSWTMDVLRDLAMELTLDVNGNNAKSPDFDPANIVQWGYDDTWISATGFLAGWDAPNVGRPTTDDYKTATANAEEWVYGLNWINNGIWEDHFIPDAAGQEAYYAVGGDPFGGGLVAMFYSHTWFMPEGLIDLPFEHDIAPMPFNQKGTRVARIHADTFTIPKEAENKEAAWEVLKWLTSPEHIIDVCLIYGCLPARESVTEDFTAALAERFPGLDYDVIFESINYLDNPNHEAFTPEWGRVQEAMENAFGQVYVGPIDDPQAVLDQANEEIQAILDEYWAGQ
jgi:multiple sugar transport system substrate-binding protein